jgi:hypothetical protein
MTVPLEWQQLVFLGLCRSSIFLDCSDFLYSEDVVYQRLGDRVVKRVLMNLEAVFCLWSEQGSESVLDAAVLARVKHPKSLWPRRANTAESVKIPEEIV